MFLRYIIIFNRLFLRDINFSSFLLRDFITSSKSRKGSFYLSHIFQRKTGNLTPLICSRYPVYAPPFSSGWATVSGIEKCILSLFLSQIEHYISEKWQDWERSSATAAPIHAQFWPMGSALTVRAPKRKRPIFCFLCSAGLWVYLPVSDGALGETIYE